MAWLYLAIAAAFEIVFAGGLKEADGFTRLVPSLITLAAGAASLAFLTFAMRSIPVSIAYPAWAAVGTVGTVLLGAMLFGEALSVMKVVCVLAILAGIVGLKMQMA
ncbi:multidrug efflux SMR transporter [Ancylobacter sp. 6x-1]|uniref:Guanidinium exporter n=1 Tax=Ancylobacter crimeensis TaxID=2579147 RepID=A0ABT0DF25_9HYPH|nr:multidrug efflux SMR transporter [Ancylobacter crimeensis]MCK0198569.1 multidrug efflux SMR transporter [Ancylobacter crimeensis]